MRGIRKGGSRVLLVLTLMSAMLLVAAVPSLAQTRRSARIWQSDIIDNTGTARAVTGRNAVRGNISVNTQVDVQDAFTDNLGGGGVQDAIAENDIRQRHEAIGDATATTGVADALGSTSGTMIQQSAENLNDSIDDTDDDSTGDGAAGSVEQDATVLNLGTGRAVSGENVVQGGASDNTQAVDQLADAFNTADDAGGEGEPADAINDAYNTATSTNVTDAYGDVITGETFGTGNLSETTVDQVSVNDNIDVSNGEDGEGSTTDQIVDVINDGIGTATSGNNSATGNSSRSVQTSSQVATSVGTSIDSATAFGFTSNVRTARNRSYGSSVVETGGATATGNDSVTTVVSSSYNSNIAVDSGDMGGM